MKIYKIFDQLAWWFRFQATYYEMKYYLKQVLKGKEDNYIKPIYHHDRCIGKTSTLVVLSILYNIPIVVPTYAWKRYEYDIDRLSFLLKLKYGDKKPIVLVANKNLLGKRHDVLLVEERLSDEQMELVKRSCKHIVGYVNY